MNTKKKKRLYLPGDIFQVEKAQKGVRAGKCLETRRGRKMTKKDLLQVWLMVYGGRYQGEGVSGRRKSDIPKYMEQRRKHSLT